MRPEIRKYLEDNADRYTRQAIRGELLKAGFEELDVDAAISEWEAEGPARRAPTPTRDFSRWTLALHAGAFVLVVGILLLLFGNRVSGYLWVSAAILAVVLLIGLGISFLIGRALLSRTGLVVALVIPLISALLIGGTCFALVAGTAGPPHRSGTLRIDVSGGVTFNGSGTADCVGEPGSGNVSIYAGNLAEIQGAQLSVAVYANSPTEIALSVSLTPAQAPGTYWQGSPAGLTVQGTADAGSMSFENIPGQAETETAPSAAEPISGSVTWNCQ
jgi:hypothetical protein